MVNRNSNTFNFKKSDKELTAKFNKELKVAYLITDIIYKMKGLSIKY